MEQIKKKMKALKANLEDAEARANRAEDELKAAHERADEVKCFTRRIHDIFRLLSHFTLKKP